MQKADANSDTSLSSNELSQVVQALSGGHVSAIPGLTQTNYVADTSNASLQSLCASIHQGIIDGTARDHNMDIRIDRCLFAMALGDRDRDSRLTQTEYPRYANQVSANEYGFSITYEELPKTIQTVFTDFKDAAGEVDITGAKSTETIPAGREDFLLSFCRQTAVAVIAERPFTTAGTTPVIPAPAPPATASTMSQTDFTSCIRMMPLSDLSRDQVFNQREYLMFANRLYDGDPFPSLPTTLVDAFEKLSSGSDGIDISGSRPGQDVEQFRDSLERICTETDLALQTAESTSPPPPPPTAPAPVPAGFSPSFTLETCKRMMAFSDLSRDDFLDQSEYFRFINRLGNNSWQGSFAELPNVIRTSFQSLSTNGRLNVSGSKPGQDSEEDDVRLQTICTETDRVIQEARGQPTTPASAPVPAPSGSTGVEPSFTFQECTRSMTFSDISRDNLLDESEYFRFVNRLVETPWSGSFANLPSSLQSTFSDLSRNGGIDVNGSKPGQNLAQFQDKLQEVCEAVSISIQAGIQGGSAPVASPPVIDTTLDYGKCVRDMIIADTSRDSKLDEGEYVRFVARNSDEIDITDELSSLSPSVQANFEALAGPDGLIDVYGSKPSETARDNTMQLEEICAATGAALAQNTPTAPPTSLVSGSVKVLNSFSISNKLRLRANQLGAERGGIEAAYSFLVQTALAEYTGDQKFLPSSTSNATRRDLLVTRLRSDPIIYMIRDNYCPVGSISANDYCQSIFGSFEVDFIDEPSAEIASTKLSNFVQDLIDPFLRDAHESLMPQASVAIIGPSFPVDPAKVTFPDLTGANFSDSWGSGPGVGQIVAGVVLLVLVAGGSVYCVRSRGLLGKWLRRAPVKKHDQNQNDISEAENGFSGATPFGGGESLPPNLRNDDPSENDDNDESVSFSVQDEDTTQRDKTADNIFNVFQLGGKKKSSMAGDDIRIMDDYEDGMDEDLVDYNFDEPTELASADITNFGDAKNSPNEQLWDKGGSESENNFLEQLASSSNADESEESSSNQFLDMSSRHSINSGMSANVNQIEGLVDRGDWDGAAKTAAHVDKFDDSYTSNYSGNQNFSPRSSQSSSRTPSSDRSESSRDASRKFYNENDADASFSLDGHSEHGDWRQRVEALVRKAAPDELGNVDNMLKRFQGREDELVRTLENMYNRKASNHKFKGVHKSKGIKERDSRGALRGNAEGNAVIAAASMLNSENPAEFEDGDSYSDEGSMHSGDLSRSGHRSHSGSYSDSYSGSYTGSHDGDSYSGSYTGSYTGSRTGSLLSGADDDDHSASTNYTDNRSFTESYTGSYNSRSTTTFTEGEQSFSLRSNDSRSHSGSQTHSYDDASFTGSYLSESYGSRGYSQRDDDRSYSGHSPRSDPRGSPGAFDRSDSRSPSDGSQGSFSGGFSDGGSYSGSYSDEGSFSRSPSENSYTQGSEGDNSVSYTGSYTEGQGSYSEQEYR